MDEETLDECYKLTVSQAMNVLRDLEKGKKENKKKFMLKCVQNALKISETEVHRKTMNIESITYPALYRRTLDSSFTLNITRCHAENDETAKKLILSRLEEFARHIRNKTIGADVVNLLCSIPSKYAIEVLDEIQKMGDKIAVVQSIRQGD